MDLSLAQPWLERLEEAMDMEHVRQTSELQRTAFAYEPVPHISPR